VIPAIGDHSHSVLLYQHKGRKQDRFQRCDRRQQRIGERIKRGEPWNCPGVYNDPGHKKQALRDNEGDRADEAADRIRDG
jgi:hypothetical protein